MRKRNDNMRFAIIRLKRRHSVLFGRLIQSVRKGKSEYEETLEGVKRFTLR